MPDHAGGHYFLTVLAPIRVDRTAEAAPADSHSHSHSPSPSHRHALAQTLALLPTGRQTALPTGRQTALPMGRQTTVSPADAPPSPFAANTLNHLARFVIIDGPHYNGRLSGDTLLSTLRWINPLTPQRVDRLSTPFLLFAADIDAPADPETGLRAYTDALWATMEGTLRAVFGHCIGFGAVDTSDAFHRYIKQCQVETTMPFNDYWPDALQVGKVALPIGTLDWGARVAGVGTLIWLAALLLNGTLAIVGVHDGFAQAIATATARAGLALLLLMAVGAMVLVGVYRWMSRHGTVAPDPGLPSVLKALFLQQHFTRFAIEAQGVDAETLHARFGTFLAAVRPTDPAPTQHPGEIRS